MKKLFSFLSETANRLEAEVQNLFTPPQSPKTSGDVGQSSAPAPPIPPQPEKKASKYLFAPIKVVGVTFKNEKGPTRQTILRKLKFRDPPFDKYADIELRKYDFEGNPAYGVYANNMQIGNIPSEYVQFVIDNAECVESISNISIYGGGRDANGYARSYGCELTLRFLKSNPPINVPEGLEISE